MRSKIPFIKSEITWISLLQRLLVFLLLSGLFYLVDKVWFIYYAFAVYILLSILLQNLIPTDHNKGIKLIKQEKFEEAIPHFKNSVDFFTKHSWIDKYRSVTLLISSRRTFREISLCNLAYCLTQVRRIDEAKKMYEDVLLEYPNNIVAKAALKTFELLSPKS
jgi:tetratricopeptide (TPR) repeat protein